MKRLPKFIPRRFRCELLASRKRISYLTSQVDEYSNTCLMLDNRYYATCRDFNLQLKKKNRFILFYSLFNLFLYLILFLFFVLL